MAADATATASASASSSSAAYLPPALPTSRLDIQAAVAKAAELRALHAALLQGGGGGGGGGGGASNAGTYASASRSPAVIRLPPAASPALTRPVLLPAAAEDYPVFAPVSGPPSLSNLLQLQPRLLFVYLVQGVCLCVKTWKVPPLLLDSHALPSHADVFAKFVAIRLFFLLRQCSFKRLTWISRRKLQFNRWSLVGVMLEAENSKAVT